MLDAWTPSLPAVWSSKLNLFHACAQETDCAGGMTHVEWCNPCRDDGEKLHPRAFKPEEVPQPLSSPFFLRALYFLPISTCDALTHPDAL